MARPFLFMGSNEECQEIFYNNCISHYSICYINRHIEVAYDDYPLDQIRPTNSLLQLLYVHFASSTTSRYTHGKTLKLVM